MNSPRIYSNDNLPLVWSVLGSTSAASSIGTQVLLRHLMDGDFAGQVEGVDEHGRSLVCRWLHSLGKQNDRKGRGFSYSEVQARFFCALLAHGSDPWQRDQDDIDALDLLFEQGADALVLEMAPQSPAGPHAWKDRRVTRHRFGLGQQRQRLPWFHAVAQNTKMARADFDVLLRLPGADIDQLDDLGNTPLFHASNPEVVRYLLEKGANPSHRNHAGEGALGWWASLSIPASDLNAMKAALAQYGLHASRSDRENDFIELAKSSPLASLSPYFAELDLDARAAEFVPAAVDRLLSCGMHYRQNIKTSWAWLAFLVKKTNAIEPLSDFDKARLHLLANSPLHDDARSNSAHRNHLRDQLDLRAPMSLPQMWEVIVKEAKASDFGKHSFAQMCLQNFRLRVGRLVEEGENLADLWLRLTLKDDAIANSMDKVLPLVPWVPGQEEQVDVAHHPRAWELLVRSANALETPAIEKAIEILLERNTPLPAIDFSCAGDVAGDKLALIEQAIYQSRTPLAPSSRPSRRI